VGNEGKGRGRRHPSRASGETGPAVHQASTGTSTIEILNAEYSNITPSSIPILGSANGMVVVE